MNSIIIICQVIIALGIFNVWLIRSKKATSWRGGEAKTMQEEFATYGLPGWFMTAIGGLKIALAVCLLIGIWVPTITTPAAFGMAVLMLGAISMHVKVGDPVKKSLPAATMLLLSLIVVLG